MENLSVPCSFYDDGNPKHEKENLSYILFNNLDEGKEKIPKSFFRSDFRGSSFRNCHLYKNNLDRADFISTTFLKCEFEHVDIASSEFKNCYFEQVNFDSNVYSNTSIQECTFCNCKFDNEPFLVNMKNCSFINCIFRKCVFERSTTEKLLFKQCTMENVDFATMHAERHKFIECKFSNVFMGISYFFGYLFYKASMDDITILYRGDPVVLTDENTLGCYAKKLWNEKRYYEYLNAHIICSDFESIAGLVDNILKSSLNDHPVLRRLEIKNVLELILFYLINSVLPFKCLNQILEVLNSFDWDKFPIDEKIEYIILTEKIILQLNEGNYTTDFITSSVGEKCLVTFHCNTDDFKKAYKTTKEFLEDLCLHLKIDPCFELVNKEKGSWFLTFALAAVIALYIPKIISSVADVVFEQRVKMKISSQVNKKLSKSNLSNKELLELTEIAQKSGVISCEENHLKLPSLIDFIKIQTD